VGALALGEGPQVVPLGAELAEEGLGLVGLGAVLVLGLGFTGSGLSALLRGGAPWVP
jgi:hypothetical protein